MSRQPRIPGTPGEPAGVLFLPPSIPDDLDEETKDALAVRNAATAAGVCPECGAVGEVSADSAPGVYHLTFRHEDECPALRDEDVA